MSYYATPRDQWPTAAEANQEPPTGPPLPADERRRLVAAVAQLQKWAAITVFCVFGTLWETGDQALAEVGDES